jgi:hypothetical protein
MVDNSNLQLNQFDIEPQLWQTSINQLRSYDVWRETEAVVKGHFYEQPLQRYSYIHLKSRQRFRYQAL